MRAIFLTVLILCSVSIPQSLADTCDLSALGGPKPDGSDYVGLVSVREMPLLYDHRLAGPNDFLLGKPLFPGAGYVDRFAQFAESWLGSDSVLKLENIRARSPLWLCESGRCIRMETQKSEKGFMIATQQGVNADMKRVSAEGFPEREASDVRDLSFHQGEYYSSEKLQDQFKEIGLQYGPAFSFLKNLRVHVPEGQDTTRDLVVEVTGVLVGYHDADRVSHRFHPGILDSALQSLGAAAFTYRELNPGTDEGKVSVPSNFGDLWIGSTRGLKSGEPLEVRTRARVRKNGMISYDLSVESEAGEPLLLIRGGRLFGVQPSELIQSNPY